MGGESLCDAHEHGEEAYSLGLHGAAIVIILVASLLGMLIPILGRRVLQYDMGRFVFILGKHFGTGVILSLGFIHLLQEGIANLSAPCLPHTWLDYPFGMLFCAVSVLLMHLVETTALLWRPPSAAATCAAAPTAAGEQKRGDDSGGKKPPKQQRRRQRRRHGSQKGKGASPSVAVAVVEGGKEKDVERQQQQQQEEEEGVVVKEEKVDVDVNALVINPSVLHLHGHSHGGLSIPHDAVFHKVVSMYVLEFGLASHSVIIGIALGVAPDPDLVPLLVAISFHQFFEGFALGARVVETGFSRVGEVVMTVIYSVSCSVGIAIGMGIHDSYGENPVAASITLGTVDAAAAGILLYIGFVSMLGHEFIADLFLLKSFLRKAALHLSVWSGLAIMAIIGLWA